MEYLDENYSNVYEVKMVYHVLNGCSSFLVSDELLLFD